MFKLKTYFQIPETVDLILILRGILASCVVYWHTIGYSISDWRVYFTLPGRVSVWLFFIISGYLISNGFFTKRYSVYSISSLKKYYWTRFLRFYPLFFLISVSSIFLTFSIFPVSRSPILELSQNNIFREVLMLQFFQSYTLNGVFWTLGIEAQFYLILPLLILAFNRVKSLSKSLIFIAISFFIAQPLLIRFFESNGDQRNILGNLGFFVVGCFMARFRSNFTFDDRFKKHMTGLVFVLTSVFFVINFSYFDNNYKFMLIKGPPMVVALGVGLILLHLYLENKKVSQNMVTTFFSFLGEISYGIYAWHGFLMSFWNVYFNFYCNIMMTIFVSMLSFILIERPLRKALS